MNARPTELDPDVFDDPVEQEDCAIDDPECLLAQDGTCALTGTSFCDYECPNNEFARRRPAAFPMARPIWGGR